MNEKKTGGQRLLQALGQVDESYIAEAEPSSGSQSSLRRRTVWGLAAACLCLALLGGTAVWRGLAPDGLQRAESQIGGPAGSTQPWGESSQGLSWGKGAVRYDELQFPEGQPSAEAVELGRSAAADIGTFDEGMLSECCAILEGTVTDIYVKHYAYDIYDDKFESGGVLHHRPSTVVYALEVETVWYGQGFSGTVLVEDYCWFPDEIFSLQVGRRYVVPLYEGEETLVIWGRYAGGEITRDSQYGTIYSYHPQIQVTSDGSYVVPGDWPTLTAEGARPVVMAEQNDEEMFREELYLVDGEAFRRQMEILAASIGDMAD